MLVSEPGQWASVWNRKLNHTVALMAAGIGFVGSLSHDINAWSYRIDKKRPGKYVIICEVWTIPYVAHLCTTAKIVQQISGALSLSVLIFRFKVLLHHLSEHEIQSFNQTETERSRHPTSIFLAMTWLSTLLVISKNNRSVKGLIKAKFLLRHK